MGMPNVIRIMKEYSRGTDAGFEGAFPCPEPSNKSFAEGWKEGVVDRRAEEIDGVFTSMYKDWEKANPPDPELGLKFVDRSLSKSWCTGREGLRMEIIRALVSSYLDDLLE